MPPNRLTCPECDATFRTATEVPAGKKVQCPKCGAPVTVAGGWEVVEDSPAPARRARVRDDDDDDYDDEPVRRRKPRKAKPKSNTGVIVAVVAILGLLFVGGLAAVGIYWLSSDESGRVASNNPPADRGQEIIPPTPPIRPPVPPQTGPGLAKGKGPAAGAPFTPTGKVGVEVGDTALEISGKDLDGKEFKLSDYRGKVVLLDFWGHW